MPERSTLLDALAESAAWNGVVRGLHGAGFQEVALANRLPGVQRDAEAPTAVEPIREAAAGAA